MKKSLALGGAGVVITGLLAVGSLDGGASGVCWVITIFAYGVLVASTLTERGQPPSQRATMILRWFVPIVFLLLAGVVAPLLSKQ